MLSGAGAVLGPGLVAALLIAAGPSRAIAQASGVLQARVQVVPARPSPALAVLAAHAPALLRSGGPIAVDSPASRARVELRMLPDTAAAGPRLRATVTYLR
jgi:hypothetical protein